MKKPELSSTTDTIVYLSAMVIALASIVVSVWQGMETRKHYRLSVRPKIEIFYNSDSERQLIGYTMCNNGLGPAMITEKNIYIDGEPVPWSGFSGYDEMLKRLGLQPYLKSHGAMGAGMTVKAGEQKNIIDFHIPDENLYQEKIMDIYSRLRFEIHYESMYGESFICVVPR